MNKLSFRVRKQYFDDIVAGKKPVEYRRDIPFWRTRVSNAINMGIISLTISRGLEFCSMNLNIPGVFLCGKRIHRRKITAISRIKTPDDFSDQGKKDVNTPLCFAFHLGEAIQ